MFNWQYLTVQLTGLPTQSQAALWESPSPPSPQDAIVLLCFFVITLNISHLQDLQACFSNQRLLVRCSFWVAPANLNSPCSRPCGYGSKVFSSGKYWKPGCLDALKISAGVRHSWRSCWGSVAIGFFLGDASCDGASCHFFDGCLQGGGGWPVAFSWALTHLEALGYSLAFIRWLKDLRLKSAAAEVK